MFSIIYITAGNEKEAEKIANELVSNRIAACVNIFPISSIFRWEGNVEKAKECGIIVKTRTSKFDEIKKIVKKIHSYDVPCIISFRIDKGTKEYLKYIDQTIID